MKTFFFAIFLIISIFGLSIFGQTQAKLEKTVNSEKGSNAQFFPVSDLKEGLKGTAWTVFRGSEPEEFQVEILGIVPGAIGPKQDMIIGKLSGGSAERTSVFAGMSGSPVYIDGKLVGAISYSFPFSKEPICGITPISQMLEIFEQNQNQKLKPKEPRSISFAELAANYKTEFPEKCSNSRFDFNRRQCKFPLGGGCRTNFSADCDTAFFQRIFAGHA